MIIYFISLTIGFDNRVIGGLFENTWIQTSYGAPLTLFGVFTAPLETVLHGGAEFSGPYWVISRMFYSSIAIFFCHYLINKFKKARIFFILLTIFLANEFFLFVGCGCAAGMLVQQYEDKVGNLAQSKGVALSIVVASMVLVGGGHRALLETMSSFFTLPAFLSVSAYWYILYFSLILIFIKKIDVLTHFLCNPLFLGLADISFGIYSFHWPVICSIGCTLIFTLYGKISLILLLFIALAAVLAITLLVSYFYHVTIERYSTQLIRTIIQFLRKAHEKVTPNRNKMTIL